MKNDKRLTTNDKLTKNYVQKSIDKLETCLDSVEILEGGAKLHDMIFRYLSDGKHFFEKKDLVAAFGCVEYAHGLLDAGVFAGKFKILKNKELFVFRQDKV